MKYLKFLLLTGLFQSPILANPWRANDISDNSDSVFKSLYRRVFSATKTLKSPENSLIEAKSDQEQSLDSRQVTFNPMDPLSYGEPKYAISAPDGANMKVSPKKATKNKNDFAKNKGMTVSDINSVYEIDSEEGELRGNLVVMDKNGNIVKDALVLTEKQVEALSKMNINRNDNGNGINKKNIGKGNNRNSNDDGEEMESQFKGKSSGYKENRPENKKELPDVYKEDAKRNKNSEEINSNNNNNDYSENDEENSNQSKVQQPISLENTEDKQDLPSSNSEGGISNENFSSENNINEGNIDNNSSSNEEDSKQYKTYPQALVSETDENNNNISTEEGVKSDNLSPSSSVDNLELSSVNTNENDIDSDINNYDINNGSDGGEWFDDFTEEYTSFENDVEGYWS